WSFEKSGGGGQRSNPARKLSATNRGSCRVRCGLKTARTALSNNSRATIAGSTPMRTTSLTGQTLPVRLAKRHKADRDKVAIGTRVSCVSLEASGHSADVLFA